MTEINPKDIVITTFSTLRSAWQPDDTGVTITHPPSGIAVSVSSEGSAHANRARAMERLTQLLERRVDVVGTPNNGPTDEELIRALKEDRPDNYAVDEACFNRLKAVAKDCDNEHAADLLEIFRKMVGL